MIIVSPGVDLTGVSDGKTVEGADGHMNDALASQSLNYTRLADMLRGAGRGGNMKVRITFLTLKL